MADPTPSTSPTPAERAQRLANEANFLTVLELYVGREKFPADVKKEVVALIPGGLTPDFEGMLQRFHNRCQQRKENPAFILMEERRTNPRGLCDFVWVILTAGARADVLGAKGSKYMMRALSLASTITAQLSMLFARGQTVDMPRFKTAVDVRVLAFLIDAGYSVEDALAFVAEQSVSVNNEAFVRIGESVGSGDSLSISMVRYPALFPVRVALALEQAESQGELDFTLRLCARQLMTDALSTPPAV